MADAEIARQSADAAAAHGAIQLRPGATGIRNVAGSLQLPFSYRNHDHCPVTQSALANLGWTFLGAPRWRMVGIPMRFVQPIELGFLILGFLGSLLVTHGLAEEDCAEHPMRAFVPWAMVCVAIGLAATWLMFQPMEMRATFMMSS